MSRVPDSYATYEARTTKPRFTEWLRDRSAPAWEDAVTHPFTRELGAGTLPRESFAAYLVQDYVFLDALVSAFGVAIGDAPDIAAKRHLVEFLDSVTDEENDFFERSFDELGISTAQLLDPPRTEATTAFLDLLGRATGEGGYAETLSVLVPAEWIYQSWASAVVEQDQANSISELPFYYAEWIELHDNPSFDTFVDWLRRQLDAVGPTVSPRREARIERNFRRTVELEAAFFDAVYDPESTGEDGG